MSYVITSPSKRYAPSVLHRESCKELAPRAKRHYVLSMSTPTYVVNLYRIQRCSLCITGDHFAEARAEAWRFHLIAARNQLAERRREYERYLRVQAAKTAFRAQFEGARVACEAAWGRKIDFVDYYGSGNLAIRLGSEKWNDVGSIYLLASDGATSLAIVGQNFSTAVIGSAADAHRLSAVYAILAGWVSPVPLDVPADAPDFYRVA